MSCAKVYTCITTEGHNSDPSLKGKMSNWPRLSILQLKYIAIGILIFSLINIIYGIYNFNSNLIKPIPLILLKIPRSGSSWLAQVI